MDISFGHTFIIYMNIILLFIPFFLQKLCGRGTWLARLVKHVPLAQVMISGFWDGAPCQAPCLAGSMLLPLPLQLPLLVLSHALTLSLKKNKKLKTKKPSVGNLSSLSLAHFPKKLKTFRKLEELAFLSLVTGLFYFYEEYWKTAK